MTQAFTNFQDYLTHYQQKVHKAQAYRSLPHESLALIQPKLYTPNNQKNDYGILLIHGLLDSCCSMDCLYQHFKGKNVPVINLLLAGHGTSPESTLDISYQDWLNDAKNAIIELKKYTQKIIVIGLSTGACIASVLALQGQPIDKLILFAPAFRLRRRTTQFIPIIKKINTAMPWLKQEWLIQTKETSPYKYQSITVNAVTQLMQLIEVLNNLLSIEHKFPCPILTIVSADDETISTSEAIKVMSNYSNDESQLRIYANQPMTYRHTANVKCYSSCIPEKKVLNYSHICMHISQAHPVYGKILPNQQYHGAFTAQNLYHYGTKLVRLTCNPHFNALLVDINLFINEAQ